jgi:hypothetical protein
MWAADTLALHALLDDHLIATVVLDRLFTLDLMAASPSAETPSRDAGF